MKKNTITICQVHCRARHIIAVCTLIPHIIVSMKKVCNESCFICFEYRAIKNVQAGTTHATLNGACNCISAKIKIICKKMLIAIIGLLMIAKLLLPHDH